MRQAVSLLASCLLAGVALAQEAPRVIVRTSLEPRSVTIGEAATLKVDILTETFFLAAPELPVLSIPGAIVTLSDERPSHLTEDVGGTTMYGLRRSYQLTPIVASNLEIPAFSIVTHPGPGQHSVTSTTTAQQLRVAAPEGAADAFVTHDLKMQQRADADLTKLKVGDSFMRTVEVTATGTPGMFIPDITFEDIDGLAAYPKTPLVSDAEPGQPMIGRRTFAIEYVVRWPGDYELPSASIDWWDLDTKQRQTATIPAMPLHAVAAPAPPPPFAVPEEQAQATATPIDWRRWLSFGGIVIAGIGLLWWLTPVALRFGRRLAIRRREHRERHLQSEAYAFARLKSALRGDGRNAVAALYRWLDRLPRATGEAATIAAVPDADFRAHGAALLDAIYGQDTTAVRRSVKAVRRVLGGTRRRALVTVRPPSHTTQLPDLNPL